MENSSEKVCEVCKEKLHQYKCPKCFIKYCSLVCYKSHQGRVPDELPETMSRAAVEFSAAERLRLYEYCVDVTRETNKNLQIPEDELLMLDDAWNKGKTDKPQTHLELLAALRDMKRRRQSYRGKNTHTSKKNQTEVIREVLGNQMELLRRLWDEEKKEQEAKKRAKELEEKLKSDQLDKKQRHSEKSRRSRSRESSRRSDRYSHRDDTSRHSRRHSRERSLHKRSRSRSTSRHRLHDEDSHRQKRARRFQERDDMLEQRRPEKEVVSQLQPRTISK